MQKIFKVETQILDPELNSGISLVKLSLDLEFEEKTPFHRSYRVTVQQPLAISMQSHRPILRLECIPEDTSISQLTVKNELEHATFTPSVPSEIF